MKRFDNPQNYIFGAWNLLLPKKDNNEVDNKIYSLVRTFWGQGV